MTNATTGGGDGAAPVWTEGNESDARPVPTREGWWIGRWANAFAKPTMFFVEDRGGELWFDTRDEEYDGSPDWNVAHLEGLIEWLAEVPPPEVCPVCGVKMEPKPYGPFFTPDPVYRWADTCPSGDYRGPMRAAIRAERAAGGDA